MERGNMKLSLRIIRLTWVWVLASVDIDTSTALLQDDGIDKSRIDQTSTGNRQDRIIHALNLGRAIAGTEGSSIGT